MDGYRSDDSENAPPATIDYYRTLGPAKFWSLMAAIGVYILVEILLEEDLGWPDSYGFHCNGRGCLIADLWHSPALLQHPGVYQIILFAWLWLFPAAAVGVIIWLAKRRSAQNPSSLYSSEATQVAPAKLRTPSVFDEEQAAADRRNKILIVLVIAIAIAAPLIALWFYKGAH